MHQNTYLFYDKSIVFCSITYWYYIAVTLVLNVYKIAKEAVQTFYSLSAYYVNEGGEKNGN